MLSDRGADAGFTLVELLISVTLLGVVLSSVSGVTFVAVRAAGGADVRLAESNDLRLAGTYFAEDVQGARSVAVGTVPRCGTDGRAVVEFAGQDFTDDSTGRITTTVVAYVVRAGTGTDAGTRQLRRLACAAATDTPAYPLVPVADTAVVRRLSAADPTVSCGDRPCTAFVQVALTVRAGSGGFGYTLTGQRRTS